MIFDRSIILSNFLFSLRYAWDRRGNLLEELPNNPIQLIILLRLLFAPIVHPSKSNQYYEQLMYAPEDTDIRFNKTSKFLVAYCIKNCQIIDGKIVIDDKERFVLINGGWKILSSQIRPDINNIVHLARFIINPIKFYKSERPKKLNSPSYFFVGPNKTNYYHWLLEYVPTMRSIYVLNHKDIVPSIIINSEMPLFVKESIEMIDDLNIRQIKTATTRALHVSEAIIPETRKFAGHDFDGTLREIEFVRSRLSTEILSEKGQCRRVFSVRDDATSRRIVNRSELASVLQEYGFHIYNPGNHSVKKQISLFQTADVVIGPHGANMANIIFSDHANVIELVGDRPENDLYELLCRAVNHKHKYLNGSTVGNDYLIPTSAIKNELKCLPET